MTKQKPRMPREGSRGFNLLNFLKKSKWVIVSRGVAEDVEVLLGIVFERKKEEDSHGVIEYSFKCMVFKKLYSLKTVG